MVTQDRLLSTMMITDETAGGSQLHGRPAVADQIRLSIPLTIPSRATTGDPLSYPRDPASNQLLDVGSVGNR